MGFIAGTFWRSIILIACEYYSNSKVIGVACSIY